MFKAFINISAVAKMTGLAMLKQGRTADAARLFGRLAGDPAVPESLRGRAAQLAASLGVDV